MTSNPDSNSTRKQTIEYVWTDYDGNLRSKARVLDFNAWYIHEPSTIPRWNYDGSSTNQAEGHDSEVIIVPRRVIKCPFRKGSNLIALCDGYNSKGFALKSNYRAGAAYFSNILAAPAL